ncbi:EAL domain-containing protein [Noviherbaspirillum sp. ST9]|uniref:EAL domain-containing protein n=1 Tax=Noviherbaspirillum sp. ST9 TaxID=3401606 RepID=UPI003B585AA0
MNDPEFGSRADEAQALRDEIVRLKKMVVALMNRAERSTSARGSDFSLFQTAVMLEDQVRRRTEDLEAALRENEKINRALQNATARMEKEIRQRQQAQDALYQSEQRYRTATEAARDIFITVDEAGKVVFVNSSIEATLGYAPGEVIGQDVGMLMPQDRREAHRKGMHRYLTTGVRKMAWLGVQIPGVHKDGRVVPLEFSFGEFVQNGRRYFTGIARDITERKRADALREGQNRVLEMIAVDAPLEESLGAMQRCIEEQYPGMLTSIVLLDEEGGKTRVCIAPSLPASYAQVLAGCSVGPASSCCGAAMHRREAVVVMDILVNPVCRGQQELAAAGGLQACWSHPIMSGSGKVLGAFTVYYRQARLPEPEERKLVELAVRIAGIAIERKQDEAYIRHMAHHDALTGLPNRLLLEDRLNQAISRAVRYRTLVAVLFIDLDHFKHVNDSLGHHVGDRLLQSVGTRLHACLRDGDSIARLGGDEFVICLAEISRNRDAAAVAQKIQAALGEDFLIDGHALQIGSSIGISLYPLDGDNVEALMRAADTAMYDAKSKGRANYQFFTPALNVAAQQRLIASNQLRQAVSREEFVLHYQPQVSLRSGAIVGVEALVRWKRGADELIPPAQFIPILEEIGLMAEAGKWVLRAACTQAAEWQKMGLPPIRLAVNLSARQFAGDDIVRTVTDTLQETGLGPEWLELEITESLILDGSERVIHAMNELKRMGVSLSLDDFGTGYSSLSYLRRFPVDRVKIDRSFVQDMTSDSGGADIVRSILALSQKLGLGAIAEGVETEAQLGYLRQQGCGEIQGYLFSPPFPAEEMTALLKSDRRIPLYSHLPLGDHTLLVVDDDARVGEALKRLLHKEGLHVLCATRVDAAFELLARNSVGVILADLDISGDSGIEFLARAKSLHPDPIRILLTGEAEIATVVNAINKGAIYKILVKPWVDQLLIENIREAFGLYAALRESTLPRSSPDTP